MTQNEWRCALCNNGTMTQIPLAAAAEIKISFSGDEARKAARALELKSNEGRSRTIHFWDSPEKGSEGVSLPFLGRGVIIRLRLDDEDRGAKRKGDMTVKLRPCPSLPSDWQKDLKDEDEGWEFTIEEDRTGPAFTPVLSASLQADRKVEAEIAESVLGPEGGVLDHLLIKPHRDLLKSAVGVKKGDLADLRALGPVHAVKWKQEWDGLPRPVAIEEWITGALRFLEVSVRTSTAEAAEAEELLVRTLRERDVEPPRFGETKTKAVLTALARTLGI
ncbi:hypothetical protein FCH28_13935 [Streptomyces piniterrae]|uniref:CYTH domain-containing protein n=1 Tax=Streptomyces piniterrae TaxID=2571125 RepID=A0A4U0NJ06_9ACTN|nr:hypothetical protein [Streptomyces piniterrae]TJZ54265.1 hypothetical protein FCH28_13935 [Streptomyces piniterrae]